MSYATDFVKYTLSIGALELVREGRKLKSGRISPYFFNSGLFNSGESMHRLAIAYAKAIDKYFEPDVIFGPAYKGIPLAVAIVLNYPRNIEYAFNRKEAKDHGEGGITIGAPLKGKHVCLVDDVMTTGDSLAEGVDIVVKAGGIPIGCMIAFDRQERASEEGVLSSVQEFQQKHKIPVCAAATFTDLIKVVQNPRSGILFILPKLLEYKEKYGV